MTAQVGDRLVVHARRQGEPERDSEVIEVRGPEGSPPYVIRWSDDGHVGLFYPGPDAYIARPEPPTAG